MAEFRGLTALLVFLGVLIFALVILVLVLHIIILLIPIAIVVMLLSWLLHLFWRKKRKPTVHVIVKKF